MAQQMRGRAAGLEEAARQFLSDASELERRAEGLVRDGDLSLSRTHMDDAAPLSLSPSVVSWRVSRCCAAAGGQSEALTCSPFCFSSQLKSLPSNAAEENSGQGGGTRGGEGAMAPAGARKVPSWYLEGDSQERVKQSGGAGVASP